MTSSTGNANLDMLFKPYLLLADALGVDRGVLYSQVAAGGVAVWSYLHYAGGNVPLRLAALSNSPMIAAGLAVYSAGYVATQLFGLGMVAAPATPSA